MRISRTAINRPITITMVFIGLALTGLFAALRLPIEQFPRVEVPFISVGIPYPNASPQEVERNVTRPVEEILSTMSGVDTLYTFSLRGRMWANLALDFERDATGKAIEAKELIEGIRHRLPDEVRYIQLNQKDPNSQPVLNLMITAPDLDPADAYDILDNGLRAELERLPGVNSVELFGIVKDYVRIALDPGRIEAYGLDYLDIQSRLMAENFFLSAGEFDTSRREFQVRPIGQYEDLDSIRRLPINSSGLVLADVASVSFEPVESSQRKRVNGNPSIGVSVFKRPEANLVAVSRAIDTVLETVRKDPVFANASFLSLDSQAETVLKSLNDLRDSGLLGGFLSLITLFIFLRQTIPSLLIAVTVPLSLSATLGVMYFTGMSLNILSLVGLMLAIGLLVDNSVVVSEAITRQRRKPGADPKTAADVGVSEVGLAITAGTLTTIIVFVPAFMTNIQMVAIVQQNIAIPLCTSLLASLLIAQTLVPSLMARLPVPREVRETPVIDWLSHHYEKIVRLTLSNRLVSFGLALAIAGSGWYAYQQLDVNMNPNQETPRISLFYHVKGSMDIDFIESYVNDVDAYLLENKDRFEIENIFTSYDTDRGRTTINLRDDGTLAPQIVQDMIMDNLPEVPNIKMGFNRKGRGMGFRGPEGASVGLSVKIAGDSTEELVRIADEIVEVLERIPGITDASSDVESRREELIIRIRPEQASQLGVTASMLARSVSVALGGRQMRNGLIERGKEIDIFLELKGKKDADIDTLRRTPIFLPSGGTVALEAIADLEFRPTLRAIRRENRETSINISFSLRNITPEEAREEVRATMQQFAMPPGYRWELGSEFERDAEMFLEMAINIGAAILLIYMLMAAIFESILFPTAVVIAIGYSVVGVYWFLFATGTTLTSMALTGMLLLGGMVVNNGIVLLNRVIQLRRGGMDRLNAIIMSGRHRLRPILLTVCTTVAGMLPLAVGDVRVGGMGPSYFPMARAIIGGLVFSTIITLIILPLVYVLLDDMKSATASFWRQARRRALVSR